MLQRIARGSAPGRVRPTWKGWYFSPRRKLEGNRPDRRGGKQHNRNTTGIPFLERCPKASLQMNGRLAVIFVLLTPELHGGVVMLGAGDAVRLDDLPLKAIHTPAHAMLPAFEVAGHDGLNANAGPIEVAPSREARFWARKIDLEHLDDSAAERGRFKAPGLEPASLEVAAATGKSFAGMPPHGSGSGRWGRFWRPWKPRKPDAPWRSWKPWKPWKPNPPDPEIPEPSSMVLLALASALCLRRRRSGRPSV